MFLSHTKKLAAMLLSVMLFMGSGLCVYADGTTSIALSNNSPEVGGKVTVTVSGSDSSTLSLRYNNDVFRYVGCSNTGATTDGNIVTFTGQSAQVTFEAISAGSGDLIVSSDTLSGSSTSVPVAAAASSTQTESETQEENDANNDSEESDTQSENDGSEDEADQESDSSDSADDVTAESDSEEESEDVAGADAALTSNASDGDGDYIIDGVEYVVSERFSEDEIPSGFSKTTLQIHGKTYDEITDGSLTLIYLKPADNVDGDGEFYVYDEELDRVSKYAVLGSSGYYITVSKPDELPSDQLVKTKITVGGEQFKVYQFGDEMSDFYFAYGTDQDGNTGWYSYDSAKETIQRANEGLLTTAASALETAEQEATPGVTKPKKPPFDASNLLDSLTSSRTMLAIGIFVLVVLLVIVLDILLFRRKAKDEDYDDYDDNFDDADEPDEVPTVDMLSDKDFDEANKPHKSRNLFGKEKSTDIWDTKDKMLSDTSELPTIEDVSKLKKQVFRGRGMDSGGGAEDGKIDVIDFNDL